MQSKLFERLVTKFSIKVNDLARYLEISKATIYNYRNLDDFNQIPNDKQYKIFYLFGKETMDELIILLDENDKNMLVKYSERIDSILNAKGEIVSQGVLAYETLERKVEELTLALQDCRSNQLMVEKLVHLDEITRKVIIEKISEVTLSMSSLEIRDFLNYLNIYAVYHQQMKIK